MIAWTLAAVLLSTAGWYRLKSMHRFDHGYVLVCAPNEKHDSLAARKYAYERSKFICAGLDGGFWLGTDLQELYKTPIGLPRLFPKMIQPSTKCIRQTDEHQENSIESR